MTKKKQIPLKLRFAGAHEVYQFTEIRYKNKNYKAIVFTGKKLWGQTDIARPGANVVFSFVLVSGGKAIGLNSQKEIYYDGEKTYERLSHTDISGSNHGKRMGLKVQRDNRLHHLIREVAIPKEVISEAIELWSSVVVLYG